MASSGVEVPRLDDGQRTHIVLGNEYWFGDFDLEVVVELLRWPFFLLSQDLEAHSCNFSHMPLCAAEVGKLESPWYAGLI